MSNIEGILLKINKKLNRIEDTNPNYQESPRWKKLREMQDAAFLEMAKERRSHYEHECQVRHKEQDERKVKFFSEYIEKNENTNKFAMQKILDNPNISDAFKRGIKNDNEQS